jgi:hypothetical protein
MAVRCIAAVHQAFQYEVVGDHNALHATANGYFEGSDTLVCGEGSAIVDHDSNGHIILNVPDTCDADGSTVGASDYVVQWRNAGDEDVSYSEANEDTYYELHRTDCSLSAMTKRWDRAVNGITMVKPKTGTKLNAKALWEEIRGAQVTRGTRHPLQLRRCDAQAM